MTESLKRVSIVLLALAFTLGLSGVLTLGMTNNAKADPPPPVTSPHEWDGRGADSLDCGKDGEGPRDASEGWIHWVFSTRGDSTNPKLTLQGSGSGVYDEYDSPANVWHFYTPYFSLEGLTATLNFDGVAGPGGGLVISDYCPGEDVNEEPDYYFTFEKEWDLNGNVIDTDSFDVTLTFDLNGKSVTIKEGEEYPVDKGDEIDNFVEGGFTLPANCTSVPTFSLMQPYTLFEEEMVETSEALSALTALPQKEIEILTVTNDVTCTKTPVTPEGEEETPVIPAGTTTQVTATPTGAVDAGAGANLIASLAGLMSSAAVVAAGVISRKFGVVNL